MFKNGTREQFYFVGFMESLYLNKQIKPHNCAVFRLLVKYAKPIESEKVMSTIAKVISA